MPQSDIRQLPGHQEPAQAPGTPTGPPLPFHPTHVMSDKTRPRINGILCSCSQKLGKMPGGQGACPATVWGYGRHWASLPPLKNLKRAGQLAMVLGMEPAWHLPGLSPGQ